jgi:very-short-patch-repair endonuclease
MKLVRACRGIASGQWGVIARRQALATGVTARQIHGCLASGEWRIELPAIYAFTDFPRSWWQWAKAAELWAGQGGALSGASAAFVWAFEGFSPGSIELSSIAISARRSCWSAECDRGWKARSLPIEACGSRELTRTIADLAATIDPPALEALVDEALRRGCTTERNLDDYLAGFNGRGPHGVARLRQVLSERVAGAAPESRLETMLARLFRTSSLPTPARQHPIVHEGRFVARVDFAWPAYRVAVEAQSRTHHADKTSFERDLARMNALTQALWTVLYITWDDGRRRPRETLDLVSRTLRRAGLR